MQVFGNIKSIIALHNGLRGNLCIAYIPCARSVTGIIADSIHGSKLKLNNSGIACNDGHRRFTDTLNRHSAAGYRATATANNRHLRFRRTIFKQGQLAVFVGNVILMPGILTDICELILNFSDGGVQSVNRCLHIRNVVLRLCDVISHSVNYRGICLLCQQIIRCFLIIVITLQSVRQVTNAVLQRFNGIVIGRFVLVKRVLNRLYRPTDFSVYSFSVCGHPLRVWVCVDCNRLDFLVAVCKLHYLGVVIKLYIKVRQSVDVLYSCFQCLEITFFGVVCVKVCLQLFLDSAGGIRNFVVNTGNGILRLLGTGSCLNSTVRSLRKLLVHDVYKAGVPTGVRFYHTAIAQRFQDIQFPVRACFPHIRLAFFIRAVGYNFKLDFALNGCDFRVNKPVETDILCVISYIDRCGIIRIAIFVHIVDLNQHTGQVNTIIIARHLERDNLAVGFLRQVHLTVVHRDVFYRIYSRKLVVTVSLVPSILLTARIIAAVYHCFRFHRGGRIVNHKSSRLCVNKTGIVSLLRHIFFFRFFKGFCQIYSPPLVYLAPQ